MGARGGQTSNHETQRQSLLDRPSTVARSDGIDIARFLLASYVIFTHLAAWGLLSATGMPGPLRVLDIFSETLFQGHGETHPAVIAFIVLSGYCIHRNGCRGKDWSVRAYAIKRVFRIVPVFLIASLIGAGLFLIAWHTNPAATRLASTTTGITLAGMLTKLSTVTALVPIAHMRTNPMNGYEGNGPLYTVAAEIWLYAIYAGLMVLLFRQRISERSLWITVAATTVAFLLYLSARPEFDIWWFNCSLVGFLPLWWIGAECTGDLPPQRVKLVVAGAGLVWAASTLYLRDSGGLAIEEARVLAFGVMCGIAIRLVDGARLRLPAVATGVGRSGYSLYAFHAPVLILLVALGITWPVVALSAIAIGLVMFYALERPTIRLGRSLASRTAVRSRPDPGEVLVQLPLAAPHHRTLSSVELQQPDVST